MEQSDGQESLESGEHGDTCIAERRTDDTDAAPSTDKGTAEVSAGEATDSTGETADASAVETSASPSGEGSPSLDRPVRQQQATVAIGAAILTGLAITVSLLQRFPDLSPVGPLLAGLLGGWVLYRLVRPAPAESGD